MIILGAKCIPVWNQTRITGFKTSVKPIYSLLSTWNVIGILNVIFLLWDCECTRVLAVTFLGRHFSVTHGGTGTGSGTATHGGIKLPMVVQNYPWWYNYHGGTATHTNIENVDCSIETVPTTIETVDCSIETGVLYNIDNIAVLCQLLCSKTHWRAFV